METLFDSRNEDFQMGFCVLCCRHCFCEWRCRVCDTHCAIDRFELGTMHKAASGYTRHSRTKPKRRKTKHTKPTKRTALAAGTHTVTHKHARARTKSRCVCMEHDKRATPSVHSHCIAAVCWLPLLLCASRHSHSRLSLLRRTAILWQHRALCVSLCVYGEHRFVYRHFLFHNHSDPCTRYLFDFICCREFVVAVVDSVRAYGSGCDYVVCTLVTHSRARALAR